MAKYDHVPELLPGYALDCLDQDEMVIACEHLAVCPDCRTEMECYRAVADRLALATPDAAPSPAVKRRLMNRVGKDHSVAPVSARSSAWQSLSRLMQRTTPAWGAVSIVLVLALVVGNLLIWQQYTNRNNVRQTAGVHIVRLAGTSAAPDASGAIATSEDGQYGTLIVQGLPRLDADRQYQLWLIQDGQRTSGAIFSVNEDGYGSVLISSPQPLSGYSAFGITIEPAGGSPGPTGPKVLGSAI
jgi:anti-sigma-K factor RskA